MTRVREDLTAWMDRHPWRFAAASFVAFGFVFPVANAALFFASADRSLERLIAEFTPVAEAAGFLTILGWWRQAGFGWSRPSLVWLLALVPLALIASDARRQVVSLPDDVSIAYVVLVALAEEAWWRGLTIRGLSPRGPTTAVLVSAGLFGLGHLSSFLRSPYTMTVTLQIIEASGSGALWGALRLRTGTIWPAVVGHGLLDLASLATGYTLRRELSGSETAWVLGVVLIELLIASDLLRGLGQGDRLAETLS